MPRRPLLHFGRGLGKMSYTLFPSERRKAIIHLLQAFPDKTETEIKKLARDVFIHLGMNFVEMAWLPRLKKNKLADFVEFDGLEILERLKKANKPVLIITGHIGNWELMAAAASLRGYKISVIAKKLNDSWLNDRIVKMRRRWDVNTIFREDEGSARKIVNVLKNGGFLALLMDQDTKTESVFVNFFGKRAYTPSGPAALSLLKTKCEVVSAYIHREGMLKHKIKLQYITPVVPSGNREIDIVNRTQQFTSVLEQAIREHPEQWVWMHKRWKTQKIEDKVNGR
jgi:KDO2-lipid IV(A) lauroyltransferase